MKDEPTLPQQDLRESEVGLTLLANAVLMLAGIALTGRGVWAAYHADLQSTAACMGFGMLALMFATVGRFEFIKGLGIEAKTRKLDRTIDEAQVILARMKLLAEMSCTALVQLAVRAGRWDSATPPGEAYELSRTVKRILDDVGATAAEVRKALMPWATASAFDVALSILKPFHRAVHSILTDNDRAVDVTAVVPYANNLMESIQSLGPGDLARRLRSIARDVPSFAPRDALERLRQEVDVWAAEMEYLERELDFRLPNAWIQKIEEAGG